MNIEEIENRFKEVTGLTNLDLSTYHFPKGDGQQQKTTKQEYKDFGFVTTPIWLVDDMVEEILPHIDLTMRTCDVCSGCGQYSIRLLRKLYTKYPGMDIETWLNNNHYFTELQFSNVAKLIYIFGTNINVYIGDTMNLKYSASTNKGLLFWVNDSWENLPLVKLPGTPSLAQQLEPLKDNLPALLKVFEGLEKQLMTREVNKRNKKKKKQ